MSADSTSRDGHVDGVRVEYSHLVVNERGHLLEIARDDDGVVPLVQVYLTATLPGVVKAWYRHHHQTDSIAIIAGQVRLGLYDDRPVSPTRGVLQIVELDATEPQRVLVPAGIWHGFASVGDSEGMLVHINDYAWDPENLDEDRRDPDDPSMPAVWS